MRAWILVALCACTVSRRTPDLECKVTTDCKNGGTCESGYCVGGGSGSATCPTSICTSGCDFTNTPTCRINSSAGSRTIDCPPGFACTIDCNGTDACGAITCGPEACTIQCTGTNACGTIDCSSSCACQVICSAGACGANSCPTGRAGASCSINNVCNTSAAMGCSNC